MKFSPFFKNSIARNGFTLVELLVVISIILITSAILFTAGGGGKGTALNSSQRILSGLVQGARGQAILKSTKARLIIHNDLDADPDKYRRYFGIVYWGDELDANGNVINSGWIAANQGTALPEGIYFAPRLSRNYDDAGSRMNLDYPRTKIGFNTNADNGGGSDNYFYYEFESNGTVLTQFQNNWIALRAGVLRPSGGNFDLDFSDPDDEFIRTALILRRTGTTTSVNDPEAITEN